METIIFEKYPTTELSQFVTEFSIETPELPQDIVEHYLRMAAIEFCERSGVLTREIKICLQACVPNYSLDAPDCTRVYRVTGVCGDCHSNYDRVNDAPCFSGCVGRSVWWDRQQRELWFHPAPPTDSIVRVRAIVVPLQDACELDTILYEEHREALLAGARARIYAIPNRTWSSPTIAQESRLEFDRRIASAGTDRLLGGMTGPVRIRYRQRRGTL